MAEIQQGGYALIFGLPELDTDTHTSVKTGTTSTPAAVKFRVTGISFDAGHSEEITYNTDGGREHVSQFDFINNVTLTGHFYDTTRANAVAAANGWDLTSGRFTGMHLLLTAKSGGTKPNDRTFSAAGKAFRVTGFRETNSTSAKATFEITAIAEEGMSYTHLT